MLLFSGTSNKPLAEKIAQHLNTSISPLEIHVFPDGEKRVRVLEKVVDEHVVVVQPTSPPVDQNYMELFLIVDALKRSGASKITLVMPYMGYQRQDHIFREGEVVSTQAIIAMLESLGVDEFVALDLHSIRIPELFHIKVKHLSALPLFADLIKKKGWSDSVLITPDMGGIRRIKQLSELLDNMPYAAIVKNRDLASGQVEAVEVQGELAKRALIVDDMISSGGTIAAAAKLLKGNGVEEIFVFATHPVFSENAPQILQNAEVEKVFVSDTIDVPKEKRFEKLEILSVAQLIAETFK